MLYGVLHMQGKEDLLPRRRGSCPQEVENLLEEEETEALVEDLLEEERPRLETEALEDILLPELPQDGILVRPEGEARPSCRPWTVLGEVVAR